MVQTVLARGRVYILFLLAVLCILLGVLVNGIFSVGAFVLFAFGMLVLSSGEMAVLCFALFPYASLFKMTPTATSLFTVCELGLVLFLLLKKKKVNALLFAVLMILSIYMVLTSFLALDVLVIIKTILPLLLVALLPPSVGETDMKNIAYLSSFSVVLSMLLAKNAWFFSYISPYFPDINYYVDSTGQVTDTVRSGGFFGDPNYCAIFIIVTLAFLCVLYYKRKVGKEFWLLFFAVSAVGFLTLSKSYMLCVVLLVSIFLLFVLIPRSKIAAIGFVIVLLLLVAVAAQEKIEIFNLLWNRFDTSETDFTSGRGTLNNLYLSYLWENPNLLLFGAGISANRFDGAFNNVHNIYIEMLFKLGVVGSVIYMVALVASIGVVFNRNRGKRRGPEYLPLFFMLLMYAFLSGLTDYALPFYIMMAMMALNIEGEESKNEIVECC